MSNSAEKKLVHFGCFDVELDEKQEPEISGDGRTIHVRLKLNFTPEIVLGVHLECDNEVDEEEKLWLFADFNPFADELDMYYILFRDDTFPETVHFELDSESDSHVKYEIKKQMNADYGISPEDFCRQVYPTLHGIGTDAKKYCMQILQPLPVGNLMYPFEFYQNHPECCKRSGAVFGNTAREIFSAGLGGQLYQLIRTSDDLRIGNGVLSLSHLEDDIRKDEKWQKYAVPCEE